MGFVTDFISDVFGGGDAADAAMGAAQTSAGAQQEALDYLREREALPMELRDEALATLGGIYSGDGEEEQALIDRARRSPLYGAIMGGLGASEDAIMRNAAATGGLRSGNTQAALADNAEQLQNQALLQSYNQQLGGLQSLGMLPSNASQIAGAMGGIGHTLGQGQIGAAQARQAALGQGIQTIMSGATAFFSDIRLKENIELQGSINGINIYTWDWNKEAREFGLTGAGSGPMAQELIEQYPEMVSELNGYKVVDKQAFAEVING